MSREAVPGGFTALAAPASGGQRLPFGARVGRMLRRQVRMLGHHLRPPRVRLVYDPAYERITSCVPMDPLRADRILAFLTNERLINREEIAPPRPVALKNIMLVHTQEYLESLQLPETVTSIMGTPVTEQELEGVLDLQRMMVGGTIQATRLTRALGCVTVNLGGGLHHASADRGAGFCIFNDIAVAITRLRRRGFAEPILVVDLDLHDGNGTRAIFARDPSVHTFSIHNDSWGDEEAVASTTIALGAGVRDELYLATLAKTLPPIVESFRPGLIIYLAGCDVAADDRLGNWQISAQGIFARDRLVVELARVHHCRLIAVLAGGYGDTAWQYSARFLAWLLSGSQIEPPDNEELTLLRFRQIKSQLNPALLTQIAGGDGWELTEEDLVGILPGIPHQTRFLGYFSKVGVELILERFGILQQLRTRGFRTPVLVFELDHPLGQTLRIFADASRRDALVELRVNRSSRLTPGMEVLLVEWLLLQNPRQQFADGRQALPGQHHPGLGMLREFFGWLVVLCESLELDGVSFYPSRYHLAAVSQRHARFAHTEAEAQVRALRSALSGLPLSAAAAALEEGRVIDAKTGQSVSWHPSPMVVPVSERMHQLVSGPEYEAQVQAALADLSYELRR